MVEGHFSLSANRPLYPQGRRHVPPYVTATAQAASWKDKDDGNDRLALSDAGSTGWVRKDFSVFWPLGQAHGASGSRASYVDNRRAISFQNIKTCTDELNISNKMTLYKVFSTKKQRQAVLRWRVLLHMALSNPAFSACRALQTKKNSKGKIREGGPEDSGRREERRVGRKEASSYSEGAQGTGRAQKRGHRSQQEALTGADVCAEAGCRVGDKLQTTETPPYLLPRPLGGSDLLQFPRSPSVTPAGSPNSLTSVGALPQAPTRDFALWPAPWGEEPTGVPRVHQLDSLPDQG